jgi:hypothetical protein
MLSGRVPSRFRELTSSATLQQTRTSPHSAPSVTPGCWPALPNAHYAVPQLRSSARCTRHANPRVVARVAARRMVLPAGPAARPRVTVGRDVQIHECGALRSHRREWRWARVLLARHVDVPANIEHALSSHSLTSHRCSAIALHCTALHCTVLHASPLHAALTHPTSRH